MAAKNPFSGFFIMTSVLIHMTAVSIGIGFVGGLLDLCVNHWD
jgi:hypothetical protein